MWRLNERNDIRTHIFRLSFLQKLIVSYVRARTWIVQSCFIRDIHAKWYARANIVALTQHTHCMTLSAILIDISRYRYWDYRSIFIEKRGHIKYLRIFLVIHQLIRIEYLKCFNLSQWQSDEHIFGEMSGKINIIKYEILHSVIHIFFEYFEI